MADCSRNFNGSKDSFLVKISLTEDKKKHLRTSRNNLREEIRSYLREKRVKAPKFYQQGSYAHHTIITPLRGDYDIDDGVYLDLSEFEETPSTRIIHNWIKEAVDGYTDTTPEDKEPCVRAIFKAGYHIDLPAYKIEKDKNENEKYYIAKKEAGWVESDPRAMTEWLKEQIKKSEQIRRLVKYFKAWRDFRKTTTSIKFPSGLTLTIFCGKEYRQDDSRDDISFHATARAILSQLQQGNDEIWKKPYEPPENMRKYLTDKQFEHFLEELENLVVTGKKAIDKENAEKAAQEWRKALGERFPVYEDSEGNNNSDAEVFERPAIVGTTVRSA